jgi:hypothetical protein
MDLQMLLKTIACLFLYWIVVIFLFNENIPFGNIAFELINVG